jgi:hypothetical protein
MDCLHCCKKIQIPFCELSPMENIKKLLKDEHVAKWIAYGEQNLTNANIWLIISAIAPIDYIAQHPDYLWNWKLIGKNPNLTIDFVRANLNENWDWFQLTLRFSIKTIFKNRDLKWEWDHISRKHDLTLEIISQHPEISWNWAIISLRNDINEILQHPELPWLWGNVSRNANLPIPFVIQNPQYLWDFESIAKYVFPRYSNALIEQNVNFLLLTSILEFYQCNDNYTPQTRLSIAEQVFANDYLVRQIAKN